MEEAMPDETTPAVDDQADVPEVDETDETDARIAELEEKLEAAQDRIAELESSPAPDGDGGSFTGVRTPELDAFEENQFRGEVQAWERDTGLSYEDTEPGVDGLDPAIAEQAEA